jgi:hypothetical protein
MNYLDMTTAVRDQPDYGKSSLGVCHFYLRGNRRVYFLPVSVNPKSTHRVIYIITHWFRVDRFRRNLDLSGREALGGKDFAELIQVLGDVFELIVLPEMSPVIKLASGYGR